ncbi:hypothetical protein [Bosea beijingensis]|uniref:hypothetical protein n=1 Tax=Bosea beijingensis TaxID=3068632 RepID=UPI00274057D1|nr:hypothetical protein [Bosea sp. REN20]
MLPKPWRDGGVTGGPPRSCQMISQSPPTLADAAIRHVVSQANWIAKSFRFGATLELKPDWIPIV